jgi:alkylation response protein AidB-like acyl-CoA dehydrogenase
MIHPTEFIKQMGELGFMGMMVDTKYGGGGMDAVSYCIAMEEISKLDASCSVAMSVNNSLVCWGLEEYGTEEQKQKYLVPLAKGEKLGAFALSEPEAGSDATSQKTTAEDKGDYYLLNGTKNWITNGGKADTYLVIAQTHPEKGHRGINVLIVEKGMPGFEIGAKEDKLGIRCSETRQLIFEDCEVPAENIVGGRENNGFLHALKTLNLSRPAVAAQAVGTAQGAFDCAVQYAREREQFGVKIATFQAIQHMLADMAIRIEGSRLLTYKSAALAEVGHKDTAKFSAMAKCYAADSAMAVATDAIQIYGGYGYTKEYPVEKYFRDAKILQIYEGTSQIQKNEIAAGLIKEAASKVRA